MRRCISCGKPIKSWYRICNGCYKIRRNRVATIPQPIVTKDFMKIMGIDGWK